MYIERSPFIDSSYFCASRTNLSFFDWSSDLLEAYLGWLRVRLGAGLVRRCSVCRVVVHFRVVVPAFFVRSRRDLVPWSFYIMGRAGAIKRLKVADPMFVK